MKDHTTQDEISHSRSETVRVNNLTMDENDHFRRNLIAAMKEQGLKEAELSVKAGLNRRAVTDIREERTRSPKLSTVFALAKALDLDPGEMMGLGARYKVKSDLAQYLSQYDEDGQGRLLDAIRLFPTVPPAKR